MVEIEALDDEEASRGLGLLRVLQVEQVLLLQQPLQVLHIVVLEVAHIAARRHDALLHGEVHALVGKDDVATLRVGWNGAGDGGEAVRVDDALLALHILGQALLELQVHVDGAVEAARTTRANAVLLDGLYCLVLKKCVSKFNSGTKNEARLTLMDSLPIMLRKLYEATLSDLTPLTVTYLETGLRDDAQRVGRNST